MLIALNLFRAFKVNYDLDPRIAFRSDRGRLNPAFDCDIDILQNWEVNAPFGKALITVENFHLNGISSCRSERVFNTAKCHLFFQVRTLD